MSVTHMNKTRLFEFLVQARMKTYAGGGGKVKPEFVGSYQLEYKEGEWLYRDVYNMGNGIFMGLETVYHGEKPVWSMSYFGNFRGMTEGEVDKILRGALIANKDKARLWHEVHWKKSEFTYSCIPDGKGSIDELSGSEEITKNDKRIYVFYYAGGLIG